MDFLKHLALPQSLEQIAVLHFVLNIVSMLFLPFVSILLGASLLSVYFESKGRRENNVLYLRFAKDIVDAIVINKSILFMFGVVPYLSTMFSFAQLLQSTTAVSVKALLVGFVFFTLSAVLLYTYKYTNKLGMLFHSFSGIIEKQKNAQSLSDEVRAYDQANSQLHSTAARYGVAALLLALFFYVAGTVTAINSNEWDSVTSLLQVFISLSVWVGFLQFVSLSLAITGIAIVFFLFVWHGTVKESDEEYSALVKRHALAIAMFGIFAQPLFVILSIVLLPTVALSGTVFLFSIVAVTLLLLLATFVLNLMKNFSRKLTSGAMYVVVVVFFFLILKDQSAMNNATQYHSAVIVAHYTKVHEELLAAMGINLKTVTGEDIFNGRCSACHMFGEKKIGPAYKDVLPKYETSKEKLIAFISNPIKIDPAFPPMPNQGLKPAEVDSIAGYILRMYKQPK